jgi:hypothetical protein
MNCESCQDALLGLVADGAEPNADLRAHLQVCADCKAFFERERSLFAAIDAGLQSSANSPLPPSFFPVLRVRINEQAASFHKPVIVRKVILAAAVAAVLALSLARLRHGAPGQPVEITPRSPQPVVETSLSPVEPQQPKFVSRPQPSSRIARPEKNVRAENRRQPPPTRNSAAEILVPADQEVLLANYADQLSRRRNVRTRISDDALSAATKPLELDLIQIAQLDVKPLAEKPE